MAELLSRPVLSDALPVITGSVSISPLPPCARFSLRLREPVPTEVASFPLNLPINRTAANGPRRAARLGPDEWLLLEQEGNAETRAREIETALAGTRHALVDISGRHAAITIEGREARTVLNGGCPLDLADTAFPAGAATRTLFGKAEIILLRPGDAPLYRLECFRSFAPYVFALLAELVREFS